jgi:hypothetical protein
LNAFLLPFGAPGDGPPCIRQRPFGIAGDWQGFPFLVRYNGTGVDYVRKPEWLRRGRNDPPSEPGEKMQIIRTKPQPSAWTKR